MFTCRTCKSEWPENYCPVCAHSIERPAGQKARPPAPRGTLDPPKPEKLTTKARVLGGTAFLILGLVGLVMGVWFPIHWARTHPGQTADIPLRIVLAAPMLVLISVAAFAGKASKTVATVLAFIGLGIGFLLLFYMRSAIAGFAGAK